MKKSQINIAFDPFTFNGLNQDIWNHQDFRDFIRSLQEDLQTDFQFFIITQSIDSRLTIDQANNFNIPIVNVYYATSQKDKFDKIVSLGIDIFFDGDVSNINYITVNSPAALNSNSFPPINALLVSWLKNNDGTMKYIQKFRLILGFLLGETL